MAYVRTVRTASGARAVQIVHGSRRGSRTIEHIGSAHDDAELEALKAVAAQRLAAGHGELELGLAASVRTGAPLEITASRMGHLWDALCRAYDSLGFDTAAGSSASSRPPAATPPSPSAPATRPSPPRSPCPTTYEPHSP